MSENKFFPSTPSQALTMLYLEKLDTSNLSPEEFIDKYTEVYMKIREYYHATARERKSSLAE